MTLELESEFRLFQIGVECSPVRLVLYISGELDLASAPLLQEHLLEAVQSEVSEVVVDLEHATYIDSAGLGVLVSAHKRLMARGCTLVICSPTSRSMKLIETAGLSNNLNVKA